MDPPVPTPTPRTAAQIHDEWLVLRAQDGDRAALGELVGRWHPRLIGLAVAIAGDDPDSARDAVQEAWLAAARTLARLEDPARFPAWICRIVAHKCADALRRARGHRFAARGKAREQPAGIVNPALAADILEEAGRIRRAIAGLGPDQRHLLGLHYGAGIGLDAIAELLGVPEGTVKSRLHAARNELRPVLERTSDEHARPN